MSDGRVGMADEGRRADCAGLDWAARVLQMAAALAAAEAAVAAAAAVAFTGVGSS